MSEGATTVGSINAYLELNIDRFLAKAAEAKSVGDDLERKPIKVRVETDTSSTSKATSEINKVAAAADKATAAVDKTGKQVQNAGQQGQAGIATLIGSLIAIVPAAVPVAAAAIGISGALTMMGAAGVLAFTGIARAMVNGSGDGVAYIGLVKTLQNDLHSLQDSATRGLLPGAQESISTIQSHMPALNQEVGVFSGMLGQMAAPGLDAVFTMLERAQPLFVASGKYLGDLITGLDKWSHGNGFQSFLDYAMQNLPNVEHLLGSLGHLVIDFLVAWAPLGSQTLPILTNLITALDNIVTHTGGVLPVVGLMVSGFIALKPVIGIVQTLAASLRDMAVAETVANAAGNGLGLGGRLGSKAAGSATGAARNFPAILGSTQAGRAAGLGAPMALDGTPLGIGATGLGISAGVGFGALAAVGLGSVVLANALGPQATSANKYNQGSVNQDIRYLMHPEATRGRGGQNSQGSAGMLSQFAQNGGQGGFVNGLAGFFGGQTGTDINNLDTAMSSMVKSGNGDKAAAIIKQLGVSTKDAAADFPIYTAALKSSTAAQIVATKAAHDLADGQAQLTGAVNVANTAAFQSMSTQNAADQALVATGDLLKKNSGDLSEHTANGVADRIAVEGAVAAINAHASALNQDGKHSAEAKLYSDQHILSLRKEGEAAGISGDKMNAYIAQLLGIPKSVITKITANSIDAEKKAIQAKQFLSDISAHKYTAIIDGNFTKAQKATATAKLFIEDMTKGNYTAILRGDFTPAQKATAKAAQMAKDFANGTFLAQLRANHVPATVATQIAKNAAQNFAHDYRATLSANNGPALSTAWRTVAQINAMRASISVSVNAVGGNGAQVARNALLGAHGGTTGSSRFGFPGMAFGGSPGGTISGPGTASSDSAGLYRLANGEEVISNLFGQADKWRPLLKAINAGRLDYRTFEQIAGRMSPKQATKHTTIAPEIHIHNPVAVDPIQQAAEAAQLALAYAGLG
jgi:hypothetical protein